MIKAILIPDVHGRNFWYSAVPYMEKKIPIIFLGDYHDPYPHENISTEESINNLKEILYYANTYKNVKLLLGNHDLAYVISNEFYGCRTDYKHINLLQDLYKNKSFYLCQYLEIADKKILVSHAGISKPWLQDLNKRLSIITTYESYLNNGQTLADCINYTLDFEPKIFKQIIEKISFYRSDFSDSTYGSVVWADIREFEAHPEYKIPFTQIVGHTMQCSVSYKNGITTTFNGPKIIPEADITCIDTAKCYYLDEKGLLHELNT